MNIFNLEDISDIGEETKSQITLKSKAPDKVMELFKLKSTLSVDEVIVGLARKFGLNKERTYILNKLYHLKECGYIKRIAGKKGLYQIVKKRHQK